MAKSGGHKMGDLLYGIIILLCQGRKCLNIANMRTELNRNRSAKVKLNTLFEPIFSTCIYSLIKFNSYILIRNVDEKGCNNCNSNFYLTIFFI